MAKLVSHTVPLVVLLLVRFGAQVILLGPVTLIWRLKWDHRGRVLWLMIVRSILHIAGLGAMFTALRFLPLAEAIAIAFVMPFLMLLLGKFVLGETVGPRRLIACLVGFIGTLMVVQPSFAAVGAPALLPVLVAVVFALFMLVTRQIAKQVEPIALQAISGAIATAILGLGVMFWAATDGSWALRWPAPQHWPLLVLIGATGTAAHLLMTWSLRFAPSATVAPMQYLEIPFATLIGLAMFGDWPNGLAGVGIVVTIATGLYILYRERVTATGA